MNWVWLDREDVLAIHELQLEEFGGAVGIRDEGMLESALSRPLNKAHYEPDSEVFMLATAYGFGLARNHPFVDGNKRAAFMSAYVFLGANGWQLVATEQDALTTMLALAAGDLSEDEFAAWLRKSCKPRTKKT